MANLGPVLGVALIAGLAWNLVVTNRRHYRRVAAPRPGLRHSDPATPCSTTPTCWTDTCVSESCVLASGLRKLLPAYSAKIRRTVRKSRDGDLDAGLG